jgi:large subunit ribosomal protein L24
MVSIKPRNQRREMYNAPQHKKRKWIASHLEENLLLKYDKRSVPVIKGDTVRIMRGSFKGHEEKIANVNTRKRNLEIEGITMAKADGKKIAKPIHASNVIITKLNLVDKWRRKKLERGLSEESKKEIEKEAEAQIKQAEEDKRKEEEKKKLEEELEKQKEESKEPKEETKEEEPKTEQKELEENISQNKELEEKEIKTSKKKPSSAKKKTKDTTKKTEKDKGESL